MQVSEILTTPLLAGVLLLYKRHNRCIQRSTDKTTLERSAEQQSRTMSVHAFTYGKGMNPLTPPPAMR